MAEWLEKMGGPAGTGDPGRVHEEGREVRQAIELAREQVASLARVPARRIVFTSGASEAANTAIASALSGPAKRALCAKVEHSAVRLACERYGLLVELPVFATGAIDLEALAAILADYRAYRERTGQPMNHVPELVDELTLASPWGW